MRNGCAMLWCGSPNLMYWPPSISPLSVSVSRRWCRRRTVWPRALARSPTSSCTAPSAAAGTGYGPRCPTSCRTRDPLPNDDIASSLARRRRGRRYSRLVHQRGHEIEKLAGRRDAELIPEQSPALLELADGLAEVAFR